MLEITKDSVKVAGSCWLPDWIPISSLINGRFYLKTLEIGFDGSIKNLEISSQPGDIQITNGNKVHNVHIDGFSLDFRNGSWYVIAENPAIIENNNVYPLDELLWNLETSN